MVGEDGDGDDDEREGKDEKDGKDDNDNKGGDECLSIMPFLNLFCKLNSFIIYTF